MIRIIIPAYNEEKNLPALLQDIAQVLQKEPYNITIINDGSKDKTLEVAHELSQQYPVTVLDHPVNRGVAEAFRTGITHVAGKAAPYDVVVIMEGDGTSSPNILPELAHRVAGGTDIVIASRYETGGRYQKFPLKRLILSKGANIVFQLLFPVKGVKDYSIFYRAYRAEVLQQALARYGEKFITVQTFFANIEILLNLRPFLRTVEEVPLVYDYGKKKGKSGMKIWKNLRSYLSFIAQHAFRAEK